LGGFLRFRGNALLLLHTLLGCRSLRLSLRSGRFGLGELLLRSRDLRLQIRSGPTGSALLIEIRPY
jgi:hypothetical protein